MPRGRLMLRTSERTTFKRCRLRWQWAYMERRKPKDASPALRFGDLAHQALAAYYPPGRKRGPHPAKTFKRLYKEETARSFGYGMRQENDEWVEAGDLGVAMMNGYVDTYGDDPDIEIIAPEFPFEVDITDGKGEYLITYVGIFDALYREWATNSLGLFEHKTTKSIGTEHLAMDEQAGTYWLFAPHVLRKMGMLPKDEDLDMILYNFLRKGMPDEREKDPTTGLSLNKNGTVSKVQPAPLFVRHPVFRGEDDRKVILQRIRAEAREIRMTRAGKLAIYKNPTKDCAWDCPFFGACELHEAGSDYEAEFEIRFKTWEPYAEHELTEEKSRIFA